MEGLYCCGLYGKWSDGMNTYVNVMSGIFVWKEEQL